uniref:Uncharacterized protein n=1 Tax=Romanomermis culicivorax TaxID=13658 RepID=A0A915HET9_ROMCU
MGPAARKPFPQSV